MSSLFREIVEGFTSGFIEGAASQLAASTGLDSRVEESGRIERLCAELNWQVDERDGNSIRLHLQDPVVGIRKVYIGNGDNQVVTFVALSHAIIPAQQVPDQVPGNLLVRNWELELGAWEATIDSDGDAVFRVAYTALGAGLDAGALKHICQTLANEASLFDRKMKAAGLLAAG